MAIKYQGVNYAGQQGNIPELIEEGQWEGVTNTLYDTFTLTADLAAGDQILMGGMLPEGATLTNCKVATAGLGGACTVNVGWLAGTALEPSDGDGQVLQAANLTGFFSALPVSAATQASAFGSTYGGNFYRTTLTSQVQPVISENAVSSGATGVAINIAIDFIRE